jgi:tRNA-specific 2-thiouridylase
MKGIKTGKNKRIVVAMSGGVDSSVAAALLKKQGYYVVGIFMKFWKDGKSTQNRCCSAESEKLARLVAKKIDIPFYVINIEKEFKKEVVDYFLAEYKKGNTPNPCVVCNKEIKFGFLIKKALSLGADYVATGHYARIKDGKLFGGKDKEKDQSYFLWQLNQRQLSRVLFPVGNYTKSQVRTLAKKFKLPTAQTPESQEVCFVQDTTKEFLKKYLKINSGNIVDKNKKLLGKHQGLWFYTIGQRRGLEIPQGPYYVVAKDFKKNNLIVSKNKRDLLQKEFIAKNVNWINPVKLPLEAEVKIRYKNTLAKAKILKYKKMIKIIFKKPQSAVTSGQSTVFYAGKELLGGGVIT